MALCVAAATTLFAGYAAAAVPWRLVVAALAVLMHAAFATYAYARGRVTSSFCVNLTWLGVVVLIVYHVWPILGLPGS